MQRQEVIGRNRPGAGVAWPCMQLNIITIVTDRVRGVSMLIPVWDTRQQRWMTASHWHRQPHQPAQRQVYVDIQQTKLLGKTDDESAHHDITTYVRGLPLNNILLVINTTAPLTHITDKHHTFHCGKPTFLIHLWTWANSTYLQGLNFVMMYKSLQKINYIILQVFWAQNECDISDNVHTLHFKTEACVILMTTRIWNKTDHIDRW